MTRRRRGARPRSRAPRALRRRCTSGSTAEDVRRGSSRCTRRSARSPATRRADRRPALPGEPARRLSVQTATCQNSELDRREATARSPASPERSRRPHAVRMDIEARDPRRAQRAAGRTAVRGRTLAPARIHHVSRGYTRPYRRRRAWAADRRRARACPGSSRRPGRGRRGRCRRAPGRGPRSRRPRGGPGPRGPAPRGLIARGRDEGRRAVDVGRGRRTAREELADGRPRPRPRCRARSGRRRRPPGGRR